MGQHELPCPFARNVWHETSVDPNTVMTERAGRSTRDLFMSSGELIFFGQRIAHHADPTNDAASPYPRGGPNAATLYNAKHPIFTTNFLPLLPHLSSPPLLPKVSHLHSPFPSQTPTSSVIPLINLHRSSTRSHFNAASNPVFLSCSTRFLSVSTGYGRRPANKTAPLGSVPRI